jgi:glycosyltransferase involved in cell wall biosynthesis
MARNAGVAASRGEFLVFLDDDDIWHEDRLRRQLAEFSRDPDAVACYSSGWHIDAAGKTISTGWPATGATREQFLSGAVDIPRIVTMMVRREPFIAVGCFSTAFKLRGDDEWILRLLRHGRFICSRDALVGYRHHESSISNAPLAERLRWNRRAILLQFWAAEARADQGDLRLMQQNMRKFRRRNASLWVGAALLSAKSGHALRGCCELGRAFGWSAPRAAQVVATRLGEFLREQGAHGRVRLPIPRDAAERQSRDGTPSGRPNARGPHATLRIGPRGMRHDVALQSILETMTPRISAYVLAADPAWLEQSVQSYYELVDRIVVSYDESGRSWTGRPLPIDDCLARLKAVDPDGKLDFRPGDYSCTEHDPLKNETYQRQQALEQASEGADWVLQVDTDEVVTNACLFRESLMEAHAGDYDALVYPARHLYQRISASLFLEHSSRFWRRLASYPGPVAVRPGVELRHCRQGATNLYVVGFSDEVLQLYFLPPVRVRKVIPVNDAILHFSWIRSEDELAAKLTSSPYAQGRDWGTLLCRWRGAARHPLLATVLTPFQPNWRDRLRLSRLAGWQR